MDDLNELRGCFKFKHLPFEDIIDTTYQLQVKKYDDDEEEEYSDWHWVTLCGGDYDCVYKEYKERWSNMECRMLQIETSVWEIEKL